MAIKNDELFPPSPRVIYKNAPLIEVASQFRYPPILRIEGQSPAEFQDRIRRDFPLFERGAAITLPQNISLPAEMTQILGSQGLGTTYRFLTEDRNSTITLSSDSLGFSTNNYTRWEKFIGNLREPLLALDEIYKPSFFSRIGLRYIDAIEREAITDIKDSPWSALFRAEILGELVNPIFESNLEGAGRQLRMRLPDGSGSILLRHGLANVPQRRNLSYMVDFDFFSEGHTEIRDAEPLLHAFHELAGRAFRWAITPKLHDALDPVLLE